VTEEGVHQSVAIVEERKPVRGGVLQVLEHLEQDRAEQELIFRERSSHDPEG
jgi:hypothetical protein